MTKTTRPEPFLIADDPALNFLNSVAAPWGTRIEWLGDGQDLLVWLEKAELVPKDAVMRLQQQASSEALDAIATQARDLREWFRGFVARRAGQRLKVSALVELGRLNHLIAQDDAYRQIEPKVHDADKQSRDARSSPLQWQQHRRWLKPEDLLLPIAQAMGDLVCGVNFERVKNCEGSTCPLWFHDVSKNHTRRWCMMAVCGNRAKAAAHRAKMQPGGQDP